MPENLKLYELPTAFAAIEAEIDANDGELTEDTEKRLDALQATLTEKVEAICQIRERYQSRFDRLMAEAQRLTDKANKAGKQIDRLEAYLQDTLMKLGQKRVETEHFDVSICKASQDKIEWTGRIDDLPPSFAKWTEPKKQLDRDKVKEALVAGAALPEGLIVRRTEYLKIS